MYIRTKEGIYDVTYWNKDDYGYYTYFEDDFCAPKHYIYEDDIINKSENLIDLCDCLMFVDKDKDFIITETNKENLNCYDDKKETCYGCINIELPNGAIRVEPVTKVVNMEMELL